MTMRPSLSFGEHGYGLLEMLVALAISGVLIGVLLQFAVATHASAGVQGEMADLQQRLRVAVEAVRREILLAGAGPSRGPARGPLVSVFAPIVPARTGTTGADPDMSFHSDRISLVHVPENGAESRLVSDMATSGSPIVIDGAAPGCRPGTACGFVAGSDVLLYEPTGVGGAHEIFTIASVDAPTNSIVPVGPLSRAYSHLAVAAAIVQRTFYLDQPGKRLMMYDGARSDVPLVDHVVALHFDYYGDPRSESIPAPPPGESNCAYAGSPPVSLLANLGGAAPKLMSQTMLTDGPACGQSPGRFDVDLLRIRRVSFTIRLEAESGEFRGRGAAFSTPGLSRSSSRMVTDQQATVDVAPRNMVTRSVMP
jgi:prepilin-type N-terminal cleavage/methylation domain-containing protein